MDVKDMRRELLKAYPGEKWRKRVEKMSDAQVTAIYLNMQEKKRNNK